jgi:hypothetical protein
MLYHIAFDISTSFEYLGSSESLGSITLETSGKPDVVVAGSTLASTTVSGAAATTLFQHSKYPLGHTTGPDRAKTARLATTHPTDSLATVLQTALRDEATTQGWTTPSGITVSVSDTTGAYTIAYSVQTFNIVFSSSLTRSFWGFSADVDSAQTYTSDQTPLYIIVPTSSDVSDFGGMAALDYEPQSPASVAAADSGDVFGISRSVEHVYRDWFQQYETKAKTIRENAVGAHLMTFQEHFEMARSYPFVVMGAFGKSFDEVFHLRTEGTQWSPQRATPGNDNQFHIPFQCHVIGRANTS